MIERRLPWLILFLLGFIVINAYASGKESTSVPGFKKVWVYGNTVNPSSVAVILSGDGGWVLGVVRLSHELAKQNVMVIGVNVMPYMRYLRKQPSDCFDMASDFDKLARNVEAKYHLNYQKPVLIGYSLGATYVYGMLAQAQAHTFRAGLSLGFCSDLEEKKIFCRGAGLECVKREKGKGYDLQPVSYLQDPFVMIHGDKDPECNICKVKDFAGKTAHTEIMVLPGIRHGGLGLRRWMPTILETYKTLTEPGFNE
ncbi:MAG: AcvB/VirJ family lysyl-phosphatidylglycerol hydrolase [Bacteroidota bacterium]|nr:AcvB/VirJ family lysyl-phosphatidylglycerol hydrolase [Bacteroidota bacterium]